METVINIVLRVSKWLSQVEKKAFDLAGLFVWGATLLVTANVVGRYFLNAPIDWAFEITQYILVWFTFLSIAWILHSDRHIRVEVLTMRLSSRAQIILDLFSDALGLFVMALLSIFGMLVEIQFFQRHMRVTSPLQPTSWPIYLVIFLGAVMTFAEFIRRIVNDSQKLRELSVGGDGVKHLSGNDQPGNG